MANRMGNFRNRESDDEDFYESDDESKTTTTKSSTSGAYDLKKICKFNFSLN